MQAVLGCGSGRGLVNSVFLRLGYFSGGLLGLLLFVNSFTAAAGETAPAMIDIPFAAAGSKVLDAGWNELHFPRISKATEYRLVADGSEAVLTAHSQQAASALLHAVDIDPVAFPRLQWRWRAQQLPAGGDISRRQGDDYAARIYITFAEDPAELSWTERLAYEAAGLLYGAYPPLRAINYVWATQAPVGTMTASVFQPRAMMFVIDSGSQYLGQWRQTERNIVADYRAAFGRLPPHISAVVVMSDSDNTASTASADFSRIRFLPR